jgi:hypothetical protein
MKLGQNIIVGRSFFRPKLDWLKTKDGYLAKAPGGAYSYLVKRVLPESSEYVVTWTLKVIDPKRKKNRIIAGGSKQVAMAYTRVPAMAIAELLEAKENEAMPFAKGRSKIVRVGSERRDISSLSWDIQNNNHAYNHEELEAYYLSRPDGCKDNCPWDLEIRYPGGPDTGANCDAWHLMNIDSLRIGQAIIALMRI